MITEAAGLLGRALGGLVTVFDPDVVVLGGGVTAVGDLLLDPLTRAVREEALPGPDQVVIRPPALGRFGGVLGAAAAAIGERPDEGKDRGRE
ncbi:ROK family protein [Streptosporangium soli]